LHHNHWGFQRGSLNSSINFEGLRVKLDDVMDGTVERAVWSLLLAWGCRGLMVKEAVGERAAEVLMKEDELKCDLCSVLGQGCI
jgi:hypothetical protein